MLRLSSQQHVSVQLQLMQQPGMEAAVRLAPEALLPETGLHCIKAATSEEHGRHRHRARMRMRRRWENGRKVGAKLTSMMGRGLSERRRRTRRRRASSSPTGGRRCWMTSTGSTARFLFGVTPPAEAWMLKLQSRVSSWHRHGRPQSQYRPCRMGVYLARALPRGDTMLQLPPGWGRLCRSLCTLVLTWQRPLLLRWSPACTSRQRGT
mmetsp:Transcript_8392/g.23180  ORF Transcript_8392/g.23180 Transcript_8392/m.23180 type:complete len:208 (-) Transcript_8392:1131-1754(-)